MIGGIMSDGGDIRALSIAGPSTPALDARLLIWLSPSFPVGAFAYSHGIEWAAERGWIRDRASLEAWLGDLIDHGSVRNDMIVIALAHRAIQDGRIDDLASVNELALAMQPSAERYLETAQQGGSFLQAIAAGWPFAGLHRLQAALGEELAYPVGVATAAAGHDLAVEATLLAYGLAFVSSLVSAAIRLSVIGQTDGQRIIASLLSKVNAMASLAVVASTDDIGSATMRSDLASLSHETQYTRLFRS